MRSKIKVLHVSQDTGGVKTYVAHILERMDREKFTFVVVAPENEIFRAFCEGQRIPYYAVDLHRGFNPVNVIKALLGIFRAIKIERPDIIHAHSAKGGFLGRLAAKIKKIKVIYTPHAFSYLPFTGGKRMVFFLLELLAKSWTSCLLAISYSEANRAIHEIGYKKTQVKTILNSIPLEHLPSEKQKGLELKVRMIGRLTPQKNHILFLEIANHLINKYPHVEFGILGAGIHDDLFAEINDYMVENQLVDKILIEKWGDAGTSAQYLRETDIYVMTSVFEGLPFSLLEAMSLGIPCVVTKVDGNTDVINNAENGFSCLSFEEFTSKIELLINDPELRKTIGTAGYNYVKTQHNITNTIQQLENLYQIT